MVKVSVIYHSGFGHTEIQAKAVCEGALSSGGVEAKLVKAEDAIIDINQFDDSDAIIFGSPTTWAQFLLNLKNLWTHLLKFG